MIKVNRPSYTSALKDDKYASYNYGSTSMCMHHKSDPRCCIIVPHSIARGAFARLVPHGCSGKMFLGV